MRRFAIFCVAAVGMVVIALAMVGCRQPKSESEEPQTPSKSVSPAPRVTTPPPSALDGKLPPNHGTRTAPPTVMTDSRLADKEAAALETDYLATNDFASKIETLYKISDLETGNAVDTLSRLFFQEKDADMKIQIIDAIGDIEGFKEKKLALLTSAVKTDQPQDVRESAINTLGDMEDARAIPILQSLLNDPDEDIRTDAEDTMKLLQDTLNQAGTP